MAGKQYQVLILGHGEIGHAVEYLLAPRHDARIWQRQARSDTVIDLTQTAHDADFVFFCLPTSPHFDLASRLRAHLPPHAICLSVAKGLDDAGRPSGQIFAEALGVERRFGALCGPMIAEEIRRGKPGFAQFATQDDKAYAEVARLFAGSALRLERSHDPIATAWAAVLKNVYAILFGIADGLDLGDNMRGYLAVAAGREMESLVRHLSGRTLPPHQLAALGDLITTATSSGSHHHAVGVQLARGDVGPLSGEGVHTVETLTRLARVPAGTHALYDLVSASLMDRCHVRQRVLYHLAELSG